jgi:hypothetical protein
MNTRTLSTSLRSALQVLMALVIGACVTRGGEPTDRSSAQLDGSPTLLVSTSPARSSPEPLQGALVTGSVYIFTSDSTGTANPAGIQQVR